jgi:hypothetical protein
VTMGWLLPGQPGGTKGKKREKKIGAAQGAGDLRSKPSANHSVGYLFRVSFTRHVEGVRLEVIPSAACNPELSFSCFTNSMTCIRAPSLFLLSIGWVS